MVFYIIRATLHRNCYSLTIKLLNVLLIIKRITKNFFFDEKLGQIELQNNLQQLAFFDLFVDGIIRFITRLEFSK